MVSCRCPRRESLRVCDRRIFYTCPICGWCRWEIRDRNKLPGRARRLVLWALGRSLGRGRSELCHRATDPRRSSVGKWCFRRWSCPILSPNHRPSDSDAITPIARSMTSCLCSMFRSPVKQKWKYFVLILDSSFILLFTFCLRNIFFFISSNHRWKINVIFEM